MPATRFHFDPARLSARLLSERMLRCLTQRQFAAAIGISEPSYRAYERGRGGSLLPVTLARLARAINITPEALEAQLR